MGRERVLLVGADYPDTPIDSFRRLLSPHYDVQVTDPFRTGGALGGFASLLPGPVERALISSGANALKGDPMAFSWPKLREASQQFEPDIVFVTCIAELAPAMVAMFKKHKKAPKVLGFFADAMVNFGRGPFFTAEYDAIFLKDPFVVNKLRKKLSWTHCFYLPEGCDPAIHHPVKLSDLDRERLGCDLTIAGNMHGFRAAELAPLLGSNLKIWGTRPRSWFQHPIMRHHQDRYVAAEEKCAAMLAAKIVLNPNHYGEIGGVNQRTFELAAMGAFQLTDAPGLADVFEPNVEVATFDSQTDMLKQIEYFLPRKSERLEIAARARTRALAHHTFSHRWVAVLEAIGLAPPVDFPIQPSDLKVHARAS